MSTTAHTLPKAPSPPHRSALLRRVPNWIAPLLLLRHPPPQGLPLCLPHHSLTAVAHLGFARNHSGSGTSGQMDTDDDDNEEEDDDESGAVDLEDELYEFMLNSGNPRSFPTRRDLIAAGRMDLVQAIANRGGWLSLGWNLEPSGASVGPTEETTRSGEAATSSSDASSSGRSREDGEREDDGGIDGILSRLERERRLSFGLSPPGNALLNGKRNSACQGGDLWRSDRLYGRYNSLDHGVDLVLNHGESQCDAEKLDQRSTMNDKDKGSSANELSQEDLFMVSDQKFQNRIQLRLQHLESKLKSTLSTLRSTSVLEPLQPEVSPSKHLHELLDDLEFQETEIMKARDKLRSIRAKMSVLEGKKALNISEAQTKLVEKQKRIDAAQEALHILRTVCVVWPNAASEVLLCGSFDGWTSQRKMERSSTNVFSLCLRLYPGQYEIKFVVDGVWRIDPLRAIIVNNDGHENNLILVT